MPLQSLFSQRLFQTMPRLLILLAASAVAEPQVLLREFQAWSVQHAKAYASDEQWQRAFSNYAENDKAITMFNADVTDPAEYDHTRFSDLSGKEFRGIYLPKVMYANEGRKDGELAEIASTDPPESIDWRNEGAVTPVKDQAACGSCWAESAVGNMESVWYLAHKDSLKEPMPLSVQQVLECDANDDACYGGYPKGAYQYVIKHGGLATMANYPYMEGGQAAKSVHDICLANQTFNETCGDGLCDDPPLTSWCDLTCSEKSKASFAKFSTWKALPTNEDQIAVYLAQNGPVSVGLDASGGVLGILFPWLQFYKKGVASPSRCQSKFDKIDHGVLLAGYGEDGGKKYWLVKNSWGSKWGEEGYFRLLRGEAKCGINLMATAAIADAGAFAGEIVV